ncbi:MAG: hypothetical protein JW854_07545 [Actinobacteria bacterium]|nr:hypothetical protein [Actinomycetota bacterium]
MAKSEEEIKKDIRDYIQIRGGPYPSWYVGISSNPRMRLFEEHSVREEGNPWIYRTAFDSTIARRIEAYFIDNLGTDGGPGGGDEASTAVYAYKKQPHTNP